MGWEMRRGKRCYYRKVREGGKIRSIYCGSGERGKAAAREDAQRRAARQMPQEVTGEIRPAPPPAPAPAPLIIEPRPAPLPPPATLRAEPPAPAYPYFRPPSPRRISRPRTLDQAWRMMEEAEARRRRGGFG